MNKKAGERVLSIYLFIIYIIVAIGIVAGVILFYGPMNIREAEAGILTDKVIDCLTDGGKLEAEVLDADFDLIEECKFDFRDNSAKYEGEERYGVKVDVFLFDSGNPKRDSIEAGDVSFLEYCGSEGEKVPECNKKEVYVLDGEDKVLLSVVSAVGKVQNA